METSRRDDLGIWPLLLYAVGCLTFSYRGLIALFDRQDRTLEGSVFLTAGLVGSIFVAHAIWKLAHEMKQSTEASQFDIADSAHSGETEDYR